MTETTWVAVIALTACVLLTGEVQYLRTGKKRYVLVYLAAVAGGSVAMWIAWGLLVCLVWTVVIGGLLGLVLWGGRTRTKR